MADNTNTTSGGIGFTGLLTIVFVIFKILGYLNWSWWWVFSPLWIGALVFLGIFIIFFVFGILVHIFNN